MGCLLDIPKAFDKVWQKELIFKLKLNAIFGDDLTDFLSSMRQRVVLNGQTPFSAKIDARVPQGSILGPLLFLICINNLTMAYHQMLNYLLTTRLYFRLRMAIMYLQMN